MYMSLLVSACLASVVVLTVVLTSYATGIKKDFDTKMRSIVDQVNTTQYYQYELEKKSYDKLNSIDNNLNNVRTKYLPRDELKDRLSPDTVDANTVSSKNVVVGDQLKFKDGINMKSADKKLNVNLPLGGGMHVKDSAGNDIMTLDDKMNVDHAKINKLQLGDKYILSGVGDAYGDDNWMRLLDPEGKDFKGGIAMSDLYVRDNAFLTGNTYITGSAATESINVKGANSEFNSGLRTYLPHTDGKNYIRGDTELHGNNTNMGDFTVKRDLNVDNMIQANKIQGKNVKLGHNWGGSWWDQSPLTVFSDKMGASFGNEFYSHFPHEDGNVYIRPGKTNKSVIIGDLGNTTSVVLGDQNTTTTVSGKLCLKDVCLTKEEMQKIKMTADDNLLQLQQALQQKLAEAQVQIEALAAEKANEQISVYKIEQETRELSLQQQIYEITQALAEIKVKLGM